MSLKEYAIENRKMQYMQNNPINPILDKINRWPALNF